MLPVLHSPAATPSQKLAAEARRQRERRIASQAHPDTPISCATSWGRSELERRVALCLAAPIPAKPKPAYRLLPNISVEQIQAAVARRCKVSVADMVSERQTADICRPRQIAMYLARCVTTLSSTAIGRKFDRDHSTVILSVKKIEARRRHDPALTADIEAIAAELGVLGGGG